MAESVSDQNVEDMLSSVRRLVSSELPRNQRPSFKEGASALVLTEAQRVEPQSSVRTQRGLTLEERIAELEAAVDGQTNDWEPDGSEDQDLHRPDRIVYRPSRPRDEAEAQRPLRLSEIALIETGPAHEDASDVHDEVAANVVEPEFHHDAIEAEPIDTPAETIAEADIAPSIKAEPKPVAPPAAFAGDPFADAIARDVAAVVAEMAESSLAAEKDFEAALAEAVRDPADTRGLRKLQTEDGTADVTPDREEDGQDSADAGPLVLEAHDAEALTFSEDYGVSFDDEDAPSDASMDAATAQPGEVAAPTPLDSVPTTPLTVPENTPTASAEHDEAELHGDDGKDENLLSLTPEHLRLLVSSMIRQELQGELGERITRNVRKMVRQEVHRALSVRDLE